MTYYSGGPGGGGGSVPLGIGHGQSARTPARGDRLVAHEFFHTFDYAGNPLHNKRRFDRRTQGSPYIFFHEGPTRIQQTMATTAPTYWGYRTDTWPNWTPLDLGLVELGYDTGPFWAYLMSTYPLGPRLSWEGPPICACQQHALPLKPPHNFELFEVWNVRVRERIRQELTPDQPLTDYSCPPEHYQTEDAFFVYNGHVAPACYQTFEYEMAILEDIVRERFSFYGTPLEESLLLDFAVKFAQAFPPWSLTNGMPESIVCADLAGLEFSCGFDPDPPDSLVCARMAAFNPTDFYSRIRFRIRDETVEYLRLTANDEATVYVGDRAVITPADSPFPDASSTYADQRRNGELDSDFQWSNTPQPQSGIFPVTNPSDQVFEIEWVNRGDGIGNADVGISRYYLALEKCVRGPGDGEWDCSPLLANQVVIERAEFWPNQGSGWPGFRQPPDVFAAGESGHNIQLRPVSCGDRPFFQPPLAVLFHPVESPAGYSGPLEVIVRHDRLTLTRPSAHLLVLTPEGVEWLGPLEQVDEDQQRVVLESCGDGKAALYQGQPALILVVARRTFHGVVEGPGQYGTLGALHYTVSIPTYPPSPLPPDRYDSLPLGNPPNNTLADATPLPQPEGDVFSGPGNGPVRLWKMTVPDLTLHNADDVDYFCLHLPKEAGDDCGEPNPNCPQAAFIGNGILEITVRGSTQTELTVYDQQGNELKRDDHYLRIACPRSSGLGRLYLSVSGPVEGRGGCGPGYYLTIRYAVPDPGVEDRFARGCIPPDGGGGGFDPEDSFRFIDPQRRLWQFYVFGIQCDPIRCVPPLGDYLLFNWSVGSPAEVEFQHSMATDLTFVLLDSNFAELAAAQRVGAARTAPPPGLPGTVTQRLSVSYLPEGFYALRVTGSKFGSPFGLRFLVPGSELRIDPGSIEYANGEFSFSWPAETGQRYRVQSKSRLEDAVWTNVTPDIQPAGPVGSFRESVLGQAARFYRIMRVD